MKSIIQTKEEEWRGNRKTKNNTGDPWDITQSSSLRTSWRCGKIEWLRKLISETIAETVNNNEEDTDVQAKEAQRIQNIHDQKDPCGIKL